MLRLADRSQRALIGTRAACRLIDQASEPHGAPRGGCPSTSANQLRSCRRPRMTTALRFTATSNARHLGETHEHRPDSSAHGVATRRTRGPSGAAVRVRVSDPKRPWCSVQRFDRVLPGHRRSAHYGGRRLLGALCRDILDRGRGDDQSLSDRESRRHLHDRQPPRELEGAAHVVLEQGGLSWLQPGGVGRGDPGDAHLRGVYRQSFRVHAVSGLSVGGSFASLLWWAGHP